VHETLAVSRYANRENRTVFAACACLALTLAAVTLVVAVEYAPWATPLVLAAGGVGVWLAWRTFKWPAVLTSPEGVTVRNPFSSELIMWSDLVEAHGGRLLELTAADGRQVRAWAVQNSNWSHLRNHAGYADEVADLLNHRQP
jgi:hypothetical protein